MKVCALGNNLIQTLKSSAFKAFFFFFLLRWLGKTSKLNFVNSQI